MRTPFFAATAADYSQVGFALFVSVDRTMTDCTELCCCKVGEVESVGCRERGVNIAGE